MVRRVALLVLGAGSLLSLACFAIDASLAGLVFALVAGAFPSALIALGAARGGRPGSLGWICLGLAVLLDGGLAGLWALDRAGAATTPIAGLPAALLVLLIGLWAAPMAFTLWAYTAHFDQFGIDADDLQRLRALRRED